MTRSDIDFPPGADPYAAEVYQRALENLQRLIANGVMIRDAEPAFYIYRQQMGRHIQTGVVGCASLDEYDRGTVKIHERTRPEKEDDRCRHIETLQTQIEPVFLAYRATAVLTELIRSELSAAPLYNFQSADGVVHTLWRATRSEEIERAFVQVPAFYIADGHHRSASASRVAKKLREQQQNAPAGSAFNFFLSVVFAHDELQILPYNRLIKSSALLPDAVLDLLERSFTIRVCGDGTPERRGDLRLYLGGRWYSLERRATFPAAASVLDRLDVSVAQSQIFEPVFGIRDPRTDKNIDFVGGIRGTGELQHRVDSGEAFAALSVFPVSIEDLFAAADAGLVMPPKSTWFEPKLRSGLFAHQFSSTVGRTSDYEELQ